MTKSKYLSFIILLLAIMGFVFISGCVKQQSTMSYEKPKSEQSEEQISPSVTIESAIATSKKVIYKNQITCTVEMSGTITGPKCSNLWAAWGSLGEPGIKLYPIACPDWAYVGTSGICSRDLNKPATTRWNITITDQYFIEGTGIEFFAVLDTPKLPLPSIIVGNPCAVAELGNRTWDSVILTCG